MNSAKGGSLVVQDGATLTIAEGDSDDPVQIDTNIRSIHSQNSFQLNLV